MANTPETVAPPTTIPVVDNIGAPDVFADGLIGAFLDNGNVHMTFVSRRCDYSRNPNFFSDVVIGRLIMPLAAAENAAKFLSDFVERMKAQIEAQAPGTILQ
jgi:hypothetical protein